MQACSTEQWGDGGSTDKPEASAHRMESSLPGISSGLTKRTLCSPQSKTEPLFLLRSPHLPTTWLHSPCFSSLLGKRRQPWLELGGELQGLGAYPAAEQRWPGYLCQSREGWAGGRWYSFALLKHQVKHGLWEPSFHLRVKGKGYSLLCSSPGRSPCRAEPMPHVGRAAGRRCRVMLAQSPSSPLLVSSCTPLLVCMDLRH